MKKKIQNQKLQYKYKTPSKLLYSLVTAGLSVVLFVSIYNLWVESNYSSSDNHLQYFLYTFTIMVTTGWLANFIARLLTHYWVKNFTLHSFNRTLLHCLIYTTLIVSGFINYIFKTFDLLTVGVILLVIKLTIFILTDYLIYNIK